MFDENVLHFIHFPLKTVLRYLLVISAAAPSWLLAVLDNDTPGSGLASPRGEDKHKKTILY